MADLPSLVERDRELAALSAAVDAIGRGEGSLIVIAGAAGTGKSALLAMCARQARARGTTVFRARGSELERGLPFGIVRQLFEPVLATASAETRERLLTGAAGGARRLVLDTPADPAALGEGDFASLHALFWLAAGIAAERPLVLAVDDLHWADAPSLRALNYLTGRFAELPVLLVVGLRPGEPTDVADLVRAVESAPGSGRLELASLSPSGVAEVVRATLPDADGTLCDAFSTASAGNPFYLRELLRNLVVAGGARPTVADVRGAAVSGVADRVLGRLRALGPAAPELAMGMAVLGTSGRIEHAAAVAELELTVAAESALAMRRVEILAAEDPFEWIHPLVRQSLYQSLTVSRRDELHARTAQALTTARASPSLIAAHLAAVRPTGSAHVVAGLLDAVEEALSRDAAEVAVTLLHRALTEEADEPSRAALLLRLGQVEVTRRNPAAVEILREARARADTPRQRAAAALSLGEILTHAGYFQESVDTVLAALAELDGTDPELALELEVARAVTFAFVPALAPQLWPDRPRLLALSVIDAWPARALTALLALTYAFRGEELDSVAPLCERALGDGRLLAERGAGAWTPGHVLGALVAVEAYDRALELADTVEAAARSQGSVSNVVVAECIRGWVATRRGDLAGAEEILRPAVETAQSVEMFLILITALWWMSDVVLERPAQDDLAALTESLELPPGFTEVAGGGWALLVRGRVRGLRGQRAEAAEDLRGAGRVFDGLGFGPLHEPWRSELALALTADDRGEARALVAEELAQANRTGFARSVGVALRADGLLAGGDEGIETLRASVTALADSPARYEQARSLIELGAALRRTSRRRDAREPLKAGAELAFACGAERLLRRAREELVAAGARPRQVVRSGFGALTASERRIVRLAAEGRSNPEIAQTLYLSVKTIETHLSNAYAKLDLSGAGARRHLPALVQRGDTERSA
jgi:DNA-binding CsgD family transcriptional regulator